MPYPLRKSYPPIIASMESLHPTCCMSQCGRPRWGWTNFMEPLCKEHFAIRHFIQDLMIMLSGCGSWGSLVVRNHPERFYPQYEEGS